MVVAAFNRIFLDGESGLGSVDPEGDGWLFRRAAFRVSGISSPGKNALAQTGADDEKTLARPGVAAVFIYLGSGPLESSW